MENKEKNIKYEFQGVGLSTSEKRFAKSRFEEYQNNYHLDSFSDSQILEELVYRETIHERYKKKIKELGKNKKVDEENIVPKSYLNSLNDNLERIILLKEKLGLFKEKKEEDEYKSFQILEKKFEIWKENHVEERKVTCPFCSQIFFLNIRTDKYQPSKLVLFKNKVLCNEYLWKCYKNGRPITKEDFAQILNVSPDQIDWLEEKIHNKPSK